MRDRDRALWTVGPGRFLSHSEELESGLHSLSLQRLDALIYTDEKKHDGEPQEQPINVTKINSTSKSNFSQIKMVPEETCDHSVSPVYSATLSDSDKWISGIKEITGNKSEVICDNNSNIECEQAKTSSPGDVDFIRTIVSELCDCAVLNSVTMRDVKLDRAEVYRRKSNRRASLIGQEIRNDPVAQTINPLLIRGHRRSTSECIVDSKDEKIFKRNQTVPKTTKPSDDKGKSETRKKKFSFNSFFHKKEKHKDEITEEQTEDYDNFDSSQKVAIYKPAPAKLKKAYSALELNQKTSPLQRTNSFIKKLAKIGGESTTNLLKRSLSVRDFTKKKDKEASSKTVEGNEQKWRQSLQSLVETDISVSYNDLSYIDYDALNNISYKESSGSQVSLRRENSRNYKNVERIERTQSMFVKGSPKARRPEYLRISSTSEEPRPDFSLSEQSGATSLPSLCHFNIQENGGNLQEPLSPTQRLFRRRPQSISSEDGSRSRSSASGSFRSAGSGCAKLKRHNACRQKNRNAASLNIEIKNESERKVRSRSLNHLDTLDMRQGVVSTSDTALKDSRSEPDCTRPILAPPAVNPEVGTPVNDVPPARKHMLSRSQKSSSECFTVNFEIGAVDETWDNELFFPAQRGFTLLDQISRICESQHIDLSTCEARLWDKENNSETLIPFTQDTANLVGRHIRITGKDYSNKKLSGSIHSNHSRKQSGSYRPRTSSFFSSSTEDSTPVAATSTYNLHDADQKKQIKQRFTAFFANTKDTKLEALVEQLDKYTKQGIPSNQNYRQGQCESVDALYKLEDDWKDIVEYSDLNEKQQQQQTVLWELIKTEVAYIKTLKVVTDLFLACLKDLQSKLLLKEIDTVKLFSNIGEILDANVIFWRNTLFPLVKNMRQYKRPPCIESMLEGFSQIHEVFQPYYIYCAEQSRCQHYCRENLDSEFFTAYLTWCESQKDCNRLRLMDILVQPMQRLTKYGLLLKAVLKNTEEDVEKESLMTMIKMVDEFVNSVNLNLKHRQDSERLKGIIARIESYDIVESKDDDVEKVLKREKHLMQLDLNRPMINCPPERKRHLLLEGDLKLKDNITSKMEVHCFLLTDMLLVCKPSTKKGGATVRVIRQPYLVDRLVIHELSRETPSLCVVYKNEFDMAVNAFILQSNDPRKIKGWKEGIIKAQLLYAQAKQIRQTNSFADESLEADYYTDFNYDSDLYHNLPVAPRSPLASSSRASRVSSLAHSHSGSVEMNDQSSLGSTKDPSRGVSVENDNRTASISSDEGVLPLPPDKSPVSQKNSFKNRFIPKTPNTLSVHNCGSLGQSLPNLTLGSPGSLTLNLNQNTLSVPYSKNGSHLLSPTHRGVSYPPPSPTRGNLRRSLAISQNKNPPLIKTRQVNSTSSASQQIPTSFDFDVPVIAGISRSDEHCESFSRGSHRQAMKRTFRYHTAGLVDDIKKNDNRDASIHKRLSWNCTSQEHRPPNQDQT